MPWQRELPESLLPEALQCPGPRLRVAADPAVMPDGQIREHLQKFVQPTVPCNLGVNLMQAVVEPELPGSEVLDPVTVYGQQVDWGHLYVVQGAEIAAVRRAGVPDLDDGQGGLPVNHE